MSVKLSRARPIWRGPQPSEKVRQEWNQEAPDRMATMGGGAKTLQSDAWPRKGEGTEAPIAATFVLLVMAALTASRSAMSTKRVVMLHLRGRKDDSSACVPPVPRGRRQVWGEKRGGGGRKKSVPIIFPCCVRRFPLFRACHEKRASHATLGRRQTASFLLSLNTPHGVPLPLPLSLLLSLTSISLSPPSSMSRSTSLHHTTATAAHTGSHWPPLTRPEDTGRKPATRATMLRPPCPARSPTVHAVGRDDLVARVAQSQQRGADGRHACRCAGEGGGR